MAVAELVTDAIKIVVKEEGREDLASVLGSTAQLFFCTT